MLLTDFRNHLETELSTRIQKNPKYGLRAFSKHLGIDSSHLSKILKGQRPLRAEMIAKLGEKLGLSQNQIEHYQRKIRKTEAKAHEETFLSPSFQLRVDQLALLSEWQHYAILELMKHPEFKPEISWISRHLHQPLERVAWAVERLIRTGLLKVERGEWKDLSDGFSTHVLGDNLTSRAHRNYQLQILELSKEALRHLPIEARDHSSIVVASSPEKIQEAKKRIRVFRRELAEFLENTSQKTDVYHLQIGLFPIPTGEEV